MEDVVDMQIEKRGDVTKLRIRGRLDAITSPLAEKKIFECIAGGAYHLLIDFTEMEYLSSAGMRMLLSTTKKLKTLSGKLVIISANANVMDVLKMSGFDHILDICQDEDEGLKHFQVSIG